MVEKQKKEKKGPTGAEVLTRLEEAVAFAETLAMPPSDRAAAHRIGEELIPALYEARTYLEVSLYDSPEIRLGISRASLVASDLVDVDPRYGPLHSRLRVLQEEANIVARQG